MAHQRLACVPNDDLKCLSVSDLERLACERMDQQTRDYYNEGADSGSTLLENITAYRNYRLRPRMMRDVSTVDSTVKVFGYEASVPFGVAPAAMQKLAHEDGELAMARGCSSMGVIMGLSSFSTTTLEAVREASGEVPNVLQLYLFEDRIQSQKLIQRARTAGYKAVILTIDTPVLGRRNQEIRNQFHLPNYLQIANFPRTDHGANAYGASVVGQHAQSIDTVSQPARTEMAERILPSGPVTFHSHGPNPTLRWSETIQWLKQECGSMQVWVKGVLTAEDALLALQHGVDGIIVSNHGGRQLDGAVATLDALPEVVAAVKKKIPVHIDGGIRHGSDVFKALALGADFCWIGRPALWGLAYNGQRGVELCLRLVTDELRRCMALTGVTKLDEIGPEFLYRRDRVGFLSRL